MALGISPTVDYAFKRLFGDPNHRSIPLHLLNALFEDRFVVRDVEILTPFLEKEFESDKLAVLDLRLRDDAGRQYNLEMQTTFSKSLSHRLVYYLTSIYSQQLTESVAYRNLAPAIGVCFLDRIAFRQCPEFHTRFQLCSLENQLVFSDQLEVHLIELPKYRGTIADLASSRALEKWIYFLRHAAGMEAGEFGEVFQEPAFFEAGGVLKMISQTEQERLRYEARIKSQRDQLYFEELSLESLEEGRKQGMLVGLEQGREQGIEQGREQGLLIGQIQMRQELLGEPVASTDELKLLPMSQLQEQAESMKQRWLAARQKSGPSTENR